MIEKDIKASPKKVRIAIVGNGVFSRLSLWFLLKYWREQKIDERFDGGIIELHIDHISSDLEYPPTSLKTTSTVCLNGITKGHSPLGDLLVDSFSFFVREIVPQFAGVFPAQHHIDYKEQDKNTRFPTHFDQSLQIYRATLEAYIIDAEIFLRSVDDKIEDLLNSELLNRPIFLQKINASLEELSEVSNVLDDRVLGPSMIELYLKMNKRDFFQQKNIFEVRSYHRVLLGTGHHTQNILHQISNPVTYQKLQRTRFLTGHFLQSIRAENKFTSEFLQRLRRNPYWITFGDYYFLFFCRGSEVVIKMGSDNHHIPTTEHENEARSVFYSRRTLESIFDFLNRHLKVVMSYEDYKLIGCFKDYEIVTGIRHKGIKRTPEVLPIFPILDTSLPAQAYLAFGFYKNGWSTGPYKAHQTILEMLKDFKT